MHRTLFQNTLRFAIVFSMLTGCDLENPAIEIKSSEIIQLSSDVNSMPADGATIVELTAALLERTDPNKDVIFRTTYGTFVNGTHPGTSVTTIRSSGRQAIARLKVTTNVSDQFFVSAELAGNFGEVELQATAAYPTDAIISANTLVLGKNLGAFGTIKINGFRTTGQVSNGIRIVYSYADTSDILLNFNRLGLFQEESTSVQVQSMNDSTGTFLFKAAIPINAEGDSIYRQLEMRVQ